MRAGSFPGKRASSIAKPGPMQSFEMQPDANERSPESTASAGRRTALAAVCLAIAAAALLASRVAAIHTVAGNWDEFVLLERAANTAATGILEGGGRPGLATLALLPIAADCEDEIATLHDARLLWLAVTAVFVAGLGVLLAQVCGPPGRRRGAVGLGLGLLVLVPAFLEWSIQVRTDQLALAFGSWGAVCLLASQRRPAWALVAGLLFGLGYLATQKLVYVGALAVVLAAGRLWQAHALRPARDVARAALCGVVFLGVISVYHLATTQALDVPAAETALASMSPTIVGAQLSEFAYYRNTIGFDQYREIAPSLVPHALLGLAMVAASVAALRSRRRGVERLWIAWAVLVLGVAVGAFHASAFAYFFMTLGIFPAVALALALGPIRELLFEGRERIAGLALAGVGAVLALQAVARVAELSIDTQAVQRESLTFVHRNFDDTDAGFHPEHGPFCRDETDPIRVFFSQVIYRHFAGVHREKSTEILLDELRDKPVKFVLQSFRLNQFPVEVRRFLADHYQPYRASVFVAGRRLEGAAGERSEFELIVPGAYRWLPLGTPQPIRIGDRVLAPGEVTLLEAGFHTARFEQDVAGGLLVLAVDDPPGIAPLAFYKHY